MVNADSGQKVIAIGTTQSFTDWIGSNVVPLLVLVIALAVFGLARKGNHSKIGAIVACSLIGLAFFGLAVSGNLKTTATSLSAFAFGWI